MPRVYVGLQVSVVVLFLFNCAADLSLGWARREERKRREERDRTKERGRVGGREREGPEGWNAREKVRERKGESARDRQIDTCTDRQRGGTKREKHGGGRGEGPVRGALPTTFTLTRCHGLSMHGGNPFQVNY